LYFKDEKTQKYWSFWMANYFDQLGLFGKVTNFAYAIFSITMTIDNLYMFTFESKGKMEYLTNFETLREKQARRSKRMMMEILGKKERKSLLVDIKKKLVFLRMAIKVQVCSNYLYDIMSCSLFIYNERPPLTVALIGILNVIIIVGILYYVVSSLLTSYTSYILTAGYFSARIDYMMTVVKQIVWNDKYVIRVLFLYNHLMMDLERQDYLLKYLLRTLIYSYNFGLSIIFVLFTIQFNPFLRVMLLTAVTVLSLAMLTSGLYVGHLNTKIMILYLEMHALVARHSLQGIKQVSYKTRRVLLNCIKELGSQQVDGQFVLGFRGGHGAAISSLEMFKLTLSTISSTLLLMDFMNGSLAGTNS